MKRITTATACIALAASIASAEVVGYWPFDSGAGMLAFDHAPAGNDALLRGATWGAGYTGGGLTFAGTDSNQHAVIPDDDALRLQPPFTVQFRWLPGGRGTRILFRKGRPGDRFTAYAYIESVLRFIVRGADGNTWQTECAVPEGDGWHHLAFVCGGDALSIIADGEVRASAPMAAEALYADASPLLIGTYSPGYRYSLAGTLDDLCISDAALAPDELEPEVARAQALEPPVRRATEFDAQQGGVVLAKAGRPGATIVIAQDATPLQLEPALELRRYLAKMTGARLPVAYDTDRPGGPLVLVGESALTGDLDLPRDLSDDEYIIRSEPGRLVLLGNDALLQDDPSLAGDPMRSKRGTSNAVFAFLQDQCKVRFFMPGRLGEVVPDHDTLEIPAFKARQRPWRTYSLGSLSRDDDWCRRHLEGSSVFIRHRGGHLWYSLIPEADHFPEHPEWFALIDGIRRGEGNHLCVSNPEMRAAALEQLRAIFDIGFEWVELGQTDGWQRCRCPECEALDDYRSDVGWWVPGVPADRIHLFHDWLAREVAQSHPGRKLLNIAYGPSAEVPAAFERFGDNVAIEFTHSPQSLIDRWTARQDRFTAYVYWWGLYQRIGFGPKSSPEYVASEVRRMLDAGVEAFYLCGGGECWSTEAPGYYVYSCLQRDPTLDEEALVNEFCDGLFGEASDTMRRYFDTFFEASERYRLMTATDPVEGEPFVGPRLSTGEIYVECFPRGWRRDCGQLLERAMNEATSDDVRARIDYFRNGFDYVRRTAECYDTLAAWQGQKTEENLAAHRKALEAREAFVDAMLALDNLRAGDLPPSFSLGREYLLRGPRDRYVDLYAPTE